MKKEIAERLIEENFPSQGYKVAEIAQRPLLKVDKTSPSLKELKKKYLGIEIENPVFKNSENSGIVNITKNGVTKAVVFSNGKIVGLQG